MNRMYDFIESQLRLKGFNWILIGALLFVGTIPSIYALDVVTHDTSKTATVENFLSSHKFDGMCGRIVKSKDFQSLENMSSEVDRKLIFLIGDDGLGQLSGKNGYEMLILIGYPTKIIEYLTNQNYTFKLLVFPQNDAKVATWENVLGLTAEVYPKIAEDLFRHQEAMKTLAFEEFELAAGYKFVDVQKIGQQDPRYMTYERYVNSSRNFFETRAFLYFTVQLNALFAGDGYTYDEEGNRGIKEYISINRKLTELKSYKLLDIHLESARQKQ